MAVRVGVIGAGLMGATHARTLAGAVSGAEVAAVSDPVREALDRVAGEADAATTYEDGLELIADPDVDGVIIASPAATHERFAVAALEAGKPVLCEKPLAPDPDASLRIVEAEAALGRRRITLGFMRRYDTGYRELKARLDAGVIGRPLMAHCVHRNPRVHDFFDSAMIITDTVVHEIDIVRWLLDQEIVRATVLTPRPTGEAKEGVRDPQLVLFETDDGQLVDVEAFVNARYGYDIRCEIVGEAGTLALAPISPVLTTGERGAALDVPPGFQQRFGEAYQHELQAWVAAIALGDEPPAATAWDGYAASAVSEAAVEALESGRPTDVRLAERPALYQAGALAT